MANEDSDYTVVIAIVHWLDGGVLSPFVFPLVTIVR